MKCFLLFHSDQFFGLLFDDVIFNQVNTKLLTSQALATKSSAGRFHRTISFAAMELFIASITESQIPKVVKSIDRFPQFL